MFVCIVFLRGVYVRMIALQHGSVGGGCFEKEITGSRIDITPDLFLCCVEKKKRVSAIHDGGVSPPRLRPTRDSFLVGGDGNVEGGTADDCAWAADGIL